MRRRLFIVYCLLAAVFLSCTPATQAPTQIRFYAFRFEPPAFLEFSADFQPVKEIPFSIPPNCGLFNAFPAPVGEFMVVELSCPNGQTVLLFDIETAAVTQPVSDSDSHFLAWSPDGEAVYLKVDSLGDTHVIRVHASSSAGSRQDAIPITGFTYDLASSLNAREFTFTFSRGLGQGSELWLARQDGNVVEQLYADPFNYISFARYSPDGKQIAFIKTPDTQTPFTVGELWVMSADGSKARKLADADAGHGYAANWSPDGKRIAFVVRENAQDQNADQSSDALISNIYTVELESGKPAQVTTFENAQAETPFWSPDGNTLAFVVVMNGRMQVQIAGMLAGEIRPLATESTCCPAWMRK